MQVDGHCWLIEGIRSSSSEPVSSPIPAGGVQPSARTCSMSFSCLPDIVWDWMSRSMPGMLSRGCPPLYAPADRFVQPPLPSQVVQPSQRLESLGLSWLWIRQPFSAPSCQLLEMVCPIVPWMLVRIHSELALSAPPPPPAPADPLVRDQQPSSLTMFRAQKRFSLSAMTWISRGHHPCL